MRPHGDGGGLRDDVGMDHQDHVSLIRGGVEGAGRRWLELGAGDGAFTLALADLLADGGDITAQDRDHRALDRLEQHLRGRFRATALTLLAADFTLAMPPGPFDGVLACNSLHFVAHPLPVLQQVRDRLSPGGRLIVVEYDADDGNRWVPHPISFERWTTLATAAGFTVPRLVHRVPSRFLGSIYGAVTEVPSADVA